MNTYSNHNEGFAKLAITAVIAIVIIFAALAFTTTLKQTSDISGNSAASAGPSLSGAVDTATHVETDKVTLSPGITADVSGLSITFKDVAQDSRCPSDVVCIQAGSVNTEVMLDADGKKTTHTISSDDKSPYVFGGYSISITNVSPNKNSKVAISPADYKVTFKID